MKEKKMTLNRHSVSSENQPREGALIVPGFYHNVLLRARAGSKYEKATI